MKGHKIFSEFWHGLGHGHGPSHDFGHWHGFGNAHVRIPRTWVRTRTWLRTWESKLRRLKWILPFSRISLYLTLKNDSSSKVSKWIVARKWSGMTHETSDTTSDTGISENLGHRLGQTSDTRVRSSLVWPWLFLTRTMTTSYGPYHIWAVWYGSRYGSDCFKSECQCE